MSRADVEADIRETLGLVPSFFSEVPDTLIESEWTSFKAVELAETAIPNKYKELIGLAVSGATRCRYCAFFHAEAARLFGATDEEIAETALMAKHTMGWSTYLNTLLVDEDEFRAEFEQIAAYVRSQAEAAAAGLMRLTRTRTNVVTLVATSQELSALVAGARMALSLMRADPRAPAEAREMLERVLADYDAGLARAGEGDIPRA